MALCLLCDRPVVASLVGVNQTYFHICTVQVFAADFCTFRFYFFFWEGMVVAFRADTDVQNIDPVYRISYYFGPLHRWPERSCFYFSSLWGGPFDSISGKKITGENRPRAKSCGRARFFKNFIILMRLIFCRHSA